MTDVIFVDVQGDNWKEDDFSWIETTYKFRENSYSTDLLIDFSIGTDIKNSSWRVIDIDQASLFILILIELYLILFLMMLLLSSITPVVF